MTTRAILQGRVRAACEEQLHDFVAGTTGVVMAQLTTADGFEVATQMAPAKTGTTARLAAMASSLWALCAAMSSETQIGKSRYVIVEGEIGHVVLMAVPHASPALSMLVVANKSAVLGQLLWSAKNATAAFGKLIASK
jgi:uncharacterized protein